MVATVLAPIDWLLIAGLLVLSLAIGYWVKDRATTHGTESFFVAGRDMRWWFLGTSIVATTFASDTPLAITGWIARYGIAGNWFWWGGVVGTVAMTVFFARKWRSAGVLTDAEIAELRYGGRPATMLRTVKAFVSAIFVNCIILGWVFAGMAKISESFMDWRYLMGPELYEALREVYPSMLVFSSFDNTLTICVLMAVTLAYSALGGLRAIILTDMLQFALAIVMSMVLVWMAVGQLGGLEQTWSGLARLYPADGSAVSASGTPFLPHDRIVAFVPDFGTGTLGSLGIPFSAFVLTLGVMWWTNGNVDGAGYIAQRLYTARDGGQAEKGALWYAYAHFLIRSWPWAMAGVVALVLYPRPEVDAVARDFTACINEPAQCSAEMQACLDNRYTCTIPEYALLYRTTGSLEADGPDPLAAAERAGKTLAPVEVFREDRERAYPALIKDVLPPGLVGLALAALIAAFMSTVSTHINWGASYIANDFYARFVNRSASHSELTAVSRLATVAIALLAMFVAGFIDNIGSMWELYGGMMAGLGLPHLMRWLWWRANAWTEIAGMLTGFSLAVANYLLMRNGVYPDGQISLFPAAMASHPIHVICWISLLSGAAALIATYATAAVDEPLLRAFVRKTRPMGFWRGLNAGYPSERSFAESALYWLAGSVSIYAGMFGVGYLLRLELASGMSLLALCLVTLVFVLRGMGRIDRLRQE